MEIYQIIEFAFNKFQAELDTENREKIKKAESQQKRINSESESLSEDSDFLDEQGNYEKKLNILHIPHIILWKTVNEKVLKLQEMTLQGVEAIKFLL